MSDEFWALERGFGRPRLTTPSLRGELLGEHPLLEAAAGVEQQREADRAVLGDIDPGDIAHFDVVGGGADRSPVGLQYVESDMSAVRQQRAAPAPGSKRAD